MKRILLAVGLVLGLSACSGPAPGVAVESLGTTYSEEQITTVVNEAGPLFSQDVSRANIVASLSASPAVFEVLAKNGVDTSVEAREELVAGLLEEYLGGLPIEDIDPATVDLLAQIQYYNTFESLQQVNPDVGPLIDELLKAPNTFVNPRYFYTSPEGLIFVQAYGDVVRPE